MRIDYAIPWDDRVPLDDEVARSAVNLPVQLRQTGGPVVGKVMGAEAEVIQHRHRPDQPQLVVSLEIESDYKRGSISLDVHRSGRVLNVVMTPWLRASRAR